MITPRLQELATRVAALLPGALSDEGPVALSPDRDLFTGALAVVRDGGAALLDTATPHLWAYRAEMLADLGAEWVPELPDGADIWEQVSLPRPPTLHLGRPPYSPARCYVSFEGEVAWEPEHGLQLVFDDTGALARVGPYDGHVTLAAAHADTGSLGIVFG